MNERERTWRWTRRFVLAVLLGVVSTLGTVALLPHWPWQGMVGPGWAGYGRVGSGRWELSYVENRSLARSMAYGGLRACPESMVTEEEVEGWQRDQAEKLEAMIVRQGERRSDGVPRWGLIAGLARFEPGREPGGAFVQVAHGWPFRAAWMQCEASVDAGAAIRGGWGRVGAAGTIHLWVPWRPLWGGLVGDVAVHGAAWMGVILLIGVVRRRWRWGPGLCEGCGYDLAGQTAGGCPECGLGREEKSA